MGIVLIFFHFFVPFGALLSRSLKRNPQKLAIVAIWILLIHYVDIYWLVMPTLYPEGVSFHWTQPLAFVGRRSGRRRLRRSRACAAACRSRCAIPTCPNRCGTDSHERTRQAT